MVTDIKRTGEECEGKLEEVEGIIQKVLWNNFGNSELSLAMISAEKECERFSSVRADLKLEAYEFMLKNLDGLIKAAKEATCQWNRWIPDEERKDFQQQVRNV